jgi:hypothetical protein
MSIRRVHELVQRGPSIGAPGGRSQAACHKPPKRRKGTGVIERGVDLEFRVAARREAAGVGDAQMAAVEEQTPDRAALDRDCYSLAPQAVERLAPECDQQSCRVAVARDGGCQTPRPRFDVSRMLESERREKRLRAGLEHCAQARRGPKTGRGSPPRRERGVRPRTLALLVGW